MGVSRAGWCETNKKHDVLVEAIALLDPKIRECIEVRIYGHNANDYARLIRKLIDERGVAGSFRWMGFLPRPADIYRDLDVLLAPAVAEGFGMTVLEANAFGVPVIAAASGGFRETICEGVNGVLVPADDAIALSKAIAAMCDDRKRASMAERSQDYVRERFSPAGMAARFVSALNDMGIEGSPNLRKSA